MKTLFFTFILLYCAAVSAYSGFHPNGGEVLSAGEQEELLDNVLGCIYLPS